MQASGVGVADDCVTVFNDLKLKHTLQYIVYGMNDAMTEIQVLKAAPKGVSYEDFCKEFPDDGCRYGVFDAEYTDPKTGGQRNKIVFYIWCAPFFVERASVFWSNPLGRSGRSVEPRVAFSLTEHICTTQVPRLRQGQAQNDLCLVQGRA